MMTFARLFIMASVLTGLTAACRSAGSPPAVPTAAGSASASAPAAKPTEPAKPAAPQNTPVVSVAAPTAQAVAAGNAPANKTNRTSCSILSKEELEAAAGFPLNAGELVTGAGGGFCQFDGQPPGAMDTGAVTVDIRPGTTAAGFTALTESIGGAPVAGIGDQASLALGEVESVVMVLRGDALLKVDVLHKPDERPSDAVVQDRLLALARTGLTRL
jgi:hypothetical protein